MPTILPPPCRAPEKPSLARRVFDVAFNTALVVSALILTFIVLEREQRYGFAPPERVSQAFEQAALQPVDIARPSTVTAP